MARILVASDNFDRANGPVGSNWTVVSLPNTTGATIHQGQISPTATGNSNMGVAYWDGVGTFSLDQYAKLTLTAVPFQDANYRMGVVVRCTPHTGAFSDYYFLQVFADAQNGSSRTHTLGVVLDGVRTVLASRKALSWVAGDTVELEVEGSTLRAYRNGVLIESVTDTTIPGSIAQGRPGWMCCGTGNVILGDDWEGGNLGSGVVPNPPTTTSATNVTQTTATVNWTHDGLNVTSFEVQRETPIGAANWAQVANSPTSAAARNLARSSLSPSTSYRHRVRAVSAAGPSAWSEGPGFTTLGTATRKLKIKVSGAALGASGVNGAVYSAPSGTDLTGSIKYAEFKSQTFESTLESGEAVLKVLASNAGVSGLALGTTVAVIMRNATNGSHVVTGTIIEE